MTEWLKLLGYTLRSRFKSRARLEAENLVLRQQLNILLRSLPKRVRLTNADRLQLIWLYRLCPSILNAIGVIRPETLTRWHQRGFRAYWRWKSRPRVGRPQIDRELRDLIRQMSMANRLWGAPRIHGELLMLGIEVAQSTVAKYMLPRSRRPPSQSWKTFLRNHAQRIASLDLFVVPTACFKLLYGLVILRHDRRRVVGFGVTTDPTAEWIAQQVTEAFPWDQAPRYLIRDRYCAYGPIFVRRVRAMGIRDRPTAPRSPWQNGHVERLIGSIRQECTDHTVVFGEAHLRRILRAYAAYYNGVRTHLSLEKNAPVPRTVQRVGQITALPLLGGLHHQYVRIEFSVRTGDQNGSLRRQPNKVRSGRRRIVAGRKRSGLR
jgi:transposase InsO family protein